MLLLRIVMWYLIFGICERVNRPQRGCDHRLRTAVLTPIKEQLTQALRQGQLHTTQCGAAHLNHSPQEAETKAGRAL